MLVKLKEGIYKQVITFPFGMREVNSYLIKSDHYLQFKGKAGKEAA
ncbi:hypothetical protein [Brevibacillus choshinensis]|nr:hypothetical protein [Brevibacillus choshinensis]